MFKRKTGKLLTGICSTALAFSMVFTTAPMTFASSVEDSGTKTVEYAESTVLFESDYNDVPDYATNRSSPWSATWSTLLAGNAFPQNIDGNGYISYTQNNMHLGVIRLGHDYETTEIGKYNYVEAIPGKTYIIEYDMKICANYFAQKTPGKLAEGWPLGSNSTMEIGVAVANPTASVADMSLLNYKNGTSDYQVFDTYATGTDPDSSKWEGNKDGWVSKKIVYTVPTDIDVSTNKALQIFIGLGIRCAVSFDNIKVSRVVTKEDPLFESNYEDAYAQSSGGLSFSTNWSSGELSPYKITENGKINTVLSYYYVGYYNLGLAILGHRYSTSSSQNVTDGIEVEPGTTYRVEYSYKVTGKGSGSINIGLAATTNYAFNKDSSYGYKTVSGVAVTLSGADLETYVQNFSGGINLTAENATGWVSASDYLTIPENSDLSLNKYLSLYVRNGGRTTEPVVYIDNVKVIAIPDSKATQAAEYFQNGMMFQQNKPMTVWGDAATSESVIKAELYKNGELLETKTAQPAANLTWQLAFSARQGSFDNYSIKIYDGDNAVRNYSDILVGELWLAAGQSNMQYTVAEDPRSELYTADENVRIFSYRTVIGGYTSSLPVTEQTRTCGSWIVANTYNSIKSVSAIAYGMCRKLQQNLNVPVGFLDVARGSTPIETWLPRTSIENNSVIKSGLVNNGKYYDESALSKITANAQKLTIMYNSKIAPLTNANIAGVIWYQGENNIYDNNRSALYKAELCELATAYSNAFGFEEGTMPFVFSHLAPYYYTNGKATISEFSETLSAAAKELKGKVKVMQTPIYDVPLDYNSSNLPIHPNHKYEVGERFADIVLNDVYSSNSQSLSAPEYVAMQISENRIILTFENVGEGLKILNDGNILNGFKISGSNGVFVNAKASIISPNQVSVWSLGVTNPTAVTYAWDNFCLSASLGNSINVPAVPFRTNCNADNNYQLSNDWLNCDCNSTWVLEQSGSNFTGSYMPLWTSEDSAKLSFVSGILPESHALLVGHSAETTSFEPVISYITGGFSLNGTKCIGVTVNNNDRLEKTFGVSVVSGGTTYRLKAVGGTFGTQTLTALSYKNYKFDTTKLYSADGSLVTENIDDILSRITRIYFSVGGTEGSIAVSDIVVSVEDSSNVFMSGDSNGDDVIDIRDIVRAKKHLAGIANAVNDMTVDFNCNGNSDASDLASLRKFLLCQ